MFSNLFQSLLFGFWMSNVVIQSFGQDWSQWRGINRDGKLTGFVEPGEWTNSWKKEWQMVVGLGESSPALVGEKLYVFTRQDELETVSCIEIFSGKELWKKQYAAPPVTGAAAPYPGTRSSPAIAQGKVITFGVAGLLTCWDSETGRVLWQYSQFTNQVPMFFTASSPLIFGDYCIAHVGGPTNGVLVSINLSSGIVKWQTGTECPAYGSPVLMTVEAQKHVVVPMSKHMAGFNFEDGHLLWQVPTPPRSGYWNSVTPVISGTSIVFSGQGNGTRAIQIEKKDDRFVTRDLWTNSDHGAVYATPIIRDEHIIGVSDRGKLYCLDIKDGKTLWASTQRHSYYASLVDTGSIIWILPEKSGLLAFKYTQTNLVELARIPVSETPVYAHPIIAGKRIFIKDKETLSMWTYK